MVFTGDFFSPSPSSSSSSSSVSSLNPLRPLPPPLPQRSGIKGNNRSCVLSRRACQGDRGHRWGSWEAVGGWGGGSDSGGGVGVTGWAAASGRHPARQILTSSPSRSPRHEIPPPHTPPPLPPPSPHPPALRASARLNYINVKKPISSAGQTDGAWYT